MVDDLWEPQTEKKHSNVFVLFPQRLTKKKQRKKNLKRLLSIYNEETIFDL